MNSNEKEIKSRKRKRKSIAVIYNIFNIDNANYIKEYLKLVGLGCVELEEINENTYKFQTDIINKIPDDIKLSKNNKKFYHIVDSIINELHLYSKEEKESYRYVAKIYAEENLYQLINQRDQILKKDFENLSQKFDDICNKKLKTEVIEWGLEETLPIQFTILNLAYYIDITAKELNEPSPFTPNSIIRISDKIISNSDNEHNIAAAILLKANILSDFIQNNIGSYELLKSLANDNDVLFYKGLCHMNTENFEEAIKYFEAISNIPKALFLKAFCEKYCGKYYHTIKSLEQFIDMIDIKIKNNKLLPNELLLLYRAYKEIGDIYNNKIYEKERALSYYLKTENIFNNIKTLINWESLYDINNKIETEKINIIIENMKKKMNIKEVCKSLSIIYNSTGNRVEAEKYYKLETIR